MKTWWGCTHAHIYVHVLNTDIYRRDEDAHIHVHVLNTDMSREREVTLKCKFTIVMSIFIQFKFNCAFIFWLWLLKKASNIEPTLSEIPLQFALQKNVVPMLLFSLLFQLKLDILSL